MRFIFSFIVGVVAVIVAIILGFPGFSWQWFLIMGLAIFCNTGRGIINDMD